MIIYIYTIHIHYKIYTINIQYRNMKGPSPGISSSLTALFRCLSPAPLQLSCRGFSVGRFTKNNLLGLKKWGHTGDLKVNKD